MQRQQSTEQKAHIWDLEDLGSGDSLVFLGSGYITLDRSLDLRLGLLICKTVRNTIPSGLPKTYQEVIIIKLTLLQVQIPKTFSKHLLPVRYTARHLLSLFHSIKSSYSGVGGNNWEGILCGGIDNTRLAMR